MLPVQVLSPSYFSCETADVPADHCCMLGSGELISADLGTSHGSPGAAKDRPVLGSVMRPPEAGGSSAPGLCGVCVGDSLGVGLGEGAGSLWLALGTGSG